MTLRDFSLSLSCPQTMDLTPKEARTQEEPTWPWHAADRAFRVTNPLSFLFLCPGGTQNSGWGSDSIDSAANLLCDFRPTT